MTFPTFEGSVESGEPIQLFRFVYGGEAGEYYAYTDYNEEITIDHGGSVGSVTYTPIPISRENVVTNGTLDRSALGLRMDIGTDLSELFRVYPPAYVVSLTIYHGHIGDPDEEFLVVWAGRVVSASRERSELVLSGEPIETQMRRTGLRRNYQYGCPFWLYGPQCKALEILGTRTGTVAAVDGNVVTLNAGWEGSFDPDKFVRGMLKWTPAGETTRIRSIIRRSGNILTLTGIANDLSASDSVSIVLGCNHKPFADDDGDCQALHDNLLNFGGQPWIPIKNVINKNPYY